MSQSLPPLPPLEPHAHSLLLAADLEVVKSAAIVTGRYQDFHPSAGVAVRATVGSPVKYSWWRDRAELAWPKPWDVPPWKEFRILDDEECRRAYTERLDRHPERVVAQLAGLVTTYPGRRLVLLCYEDVNGGEGCHRRWFADWMWSRYGVEIPELPR